MMKSAGASAHGGEGSNRNLSQSWRNWRGFPRWSHCRTRGDDGAWRPGVAVELVSVDHRGRVGLRGGPAARVVPAVAFVDAAATRVAAVAAAAAAAAGGGVGRSLVATIGCGAIYHHAASPGSGNGAASRAGAGPSGRARLGARPAVGPPGAVADRGLPFASSGRSHPGGPACLGRRTWTARSGGASGAAHSRSSAGALR